MKRSVSYSAGRDPLSLLSSTLELLQWKDNIDDSGKVLEPLCQAVTFLLQQLKGLSTSPEESESQIAGASIASESSAWYSPRIEKQLKIDRMTQ